MRLHELRVRAFGPFAGEVEVDFDEVGQDGLFLVQGPTGSGKTSVLDAVSFALYAGVPGGRASGQALRSHHAAPDVGPQVALTFSVGDERWRIVRSPAWQRPGRATPVPASVTLARWDGAVWAEQSARSDEVGDIILDLLGMGRAQFERVVILPQGDFAAFLRASADERRRVLEHLFDISTFADIEAWLAQTRRLTTAAVSAQESEVARLEHELIEALVVAGLEPVGHEDVVDQLVAAAAEALTAADEADGAQSVAQRAHAAGLLSARARERGEAATAVLAELAAQAQDVSVARTRLRLSEAASAGRGHLDALDHAEEQVEATQGLAGQAAAATFGLLGVQRTRADGGGLGGAPASAPGERPASQTLRELGTALAQGTSALHGVEQLVATSTQLVREVATAVATRDDAASVCQSALTGHTQAVQALDQADERRVELADLARPLTALKAEVERLTALAELRRDHDQAGGLLGALEDEVRLATDGHLVARERFIELRERRHRAQAAVLAAALAAGAPCPVCGSCEHPQLAVTADTISDQQLADAEDAVSRAEASLTAARSTLAGHQGAQRLREQQLTGEQRDAATLLAAAADAHARRQRAAQAQAELERSDAARPALLDAVQSSRDEADRAGRRLQEAETSLAVLQARSADAAAEVREATTRHTSCPCAGAASERSPSAMVTWHHEVVTAVEQAIASLGQLAEHERQRDRVRRAAERAAVDLGFADLAALRSALCSRDDESRLRARLSAYDTARSTAEATLTDPDVSAAMAAAPVDVEALASAVREATRVARVAVQRHTRIQTALSHAQRLQSDATAATAQLAPLRERHRVVSDLADLAGGRGGNRLRMPLTSYVLAARLERVAELANERLRVLGEGRFRLRHTDERAGGGKSGLGLEVLDLWTGQARATSTLSGGESFMASLALALGLADAVHEEAGGRELQTLFIDEGFGTLDDDSLEQVLTVLDGLRHGGRAVGVVSHVADLRTRIPRQIVVDKAVCGSTLHVTGPSAA